MLTELFPAVLPTRTETLPGGVSFHMVKIPGGRFEMGNEDGEEESYSEERPKHWVEVPAFELAEFPVTQNLWDAISDLLTEAERGKIPINPSSFRGAHRPVERVNWHQATAFCVALTRLTGTAYRLPSEAEWEYAARCGQRDRLYAGSNLLREVGWYDENSDRETKPVGLLYPNGWGLYDMSGNVWEWCADRWHDIYNGAPDDGSAWLSDGAATGRVVRGGSWNDGTWNCRCAYRSDLSPDGRDSYQGFRLAAPQFRSGPVRPLRTERPIQKAPAG